MPALERLSSRALADALKNVRLAREILVFDEVESTNDVAARMGDEGSEEGLVIFAEKQSAGRGRMGRYWSSEPHLGLWFSLLLRPNFATELWMRLTTWAAVGAARGIEIATGIETQIKWPNDILVQGRKVTGILLETHRAGGRGFAVAGLGVNVNQTSFEPPLDLRAISLRQASGRQLDRELIAVAILKELDRLYQEIETGFVAIVEEAARRSSLMGKRIEVDWGGARFAGIVENLDHDGLLIFRDNEGQIRHLPGGEVTLATIE